MNNLAVTVAWVLAALFLGPTIAKKVEELSREQLITFIEGNVFCAWPFY